MPGKLDAAIAAAMAASPLLGMVPVVGSALPLALAIIKQYRQTRDAIEAMNPGTSGMLPDPELFDLLQQDSEALVVHADALIAKWSAP
jgi:predicted Zn-dependent protease